LSSFLFHSPFLVDASACGIFLASENRSPMVSSAVDMTFPDGAFMTSMPLSVAAATSMLSTPMPALPMTFSFEAWMTFFVALVALLTRRTS